MIYSDAHETCIRTLMPTPYGMHEFHVASIHGRSFIRDVTMARELMFQTVVGKYMWGYFETLDYKHPLVNISGIPEWSIESGCDTDLIGIPAILTFECFRGVYKPEIIDGHERLWLSRLTESTSVVFVLSEEADNKCLYRRKNGARRATR